jgi:alkaline phosphatase D
MLREFLSSRNVVVVGGDRHWQYVSVDTETGLWEFGSGALARGRAGEWKSGDLRPEHRFLAVKPGFIWGTVDREDGEPILTIEHRSRTGEVRNTEQFTANPVEHRG